MPKYRAIVSIFLDDDDIASFAEVFGVDPDRLDPHALISGELDNTGLSGYWIEQLFEDGRPTIGRLSGGITVEVNEHDD